MKHLSEEQLVLLYYGEPEGASDAEHLETCRECRAAYDELAATLARVEAPAVPERGEDYGAEVWQRVRPRLQWRGRFRLRIRVPRYWALAAAMAALLVAAFVAGRWSRPQQPAPTQAAVAPQVRERVLLVAVGEHLDRSQMVLMELVNARPAPQVDISEEQQRAGDLIASNRLYRQTARRAGETAVASVLDELERVLLEIAHSPSELSAHEFEELRQRVEEQGILFKVRIIDSKVREKALPRSS